MRTFLFAIAIAIQTALSIQASAQSGGLSLSDVAGTLQQRYDYNFEKVRDAYKTLMNLALINSANQQSLSAYQKQVSSWDGYSKVDLSKAEKFNLVYQFVTAYQQNKNIMQEVKFLDNLYTELSLLKSNFPGTFYNMQRYKDLKTAMVTLQNCRPEDISSLAWKYDLMSLF